MSVATRVSQSSSGARGNCGCSCDGQRDGATWVVAKLSEPGCYEYA